MGKLGITILGSGSQGNATMIHGDGQAVMVDAGFSCKELVSRLKRSGLDEVSVNGILVTHSHTDHIHGVRQCSTKLEAPIYATSGCAVAMRCRDNKLGQLATFAPGSNFSIGDFGICPFLIPHDAEEPVAFCIYWHDIKIGIATDLGYVSSGVEYNLKNCDVLVVESNHDLNMLAASRRPWNLKQRIMGRQGHLSNSASGQLLERIVGPNTRHVVLAHISQECNTYEKAFENADETLTRLNRRDIILTVAKQDAPHETIWMECQR